MNIPGSLKDTNSQINTTERWAEKAPPKKTADEKIQKLFFSDPKTSPTSTSSKSLKDNSITAQDSSSKSTSPLSKSSSSAFRIMPRLILPKPATIPDDLKVVDYEAEETLSNKTCQRSYKESKDT